jgi:bis(5'-adenosyl)-triphosphatase
VHVHVIPRVKGDMGEEPMDEIYVHLSSEKANVGGALWDREQAQRPRPGGKMPRIEDAERNAKTMEEMVEEAERYKAALGEMGVGNSARGGERL